MPDSKRFLTGSVDKNIIMSDMEGVCSKGRQMPFYFVTFGFLSRVDLL